MKNTITSFLLATSFFSFSQNVQVDSTYALNGINKLNIVSGADDQALFSAVQPDGKVLICGPSYNPAVNETFPFISRYLADGSLDTTFSSTGKQVLTNFATCAPQSVILQNDGKIILAGQDYFQSKLRGILIRLMPNGQIDSSFNSSGYVRTTVAFKDHFGRSVAMQDDKIILAGFIEQSSINSDFFATRFLASGKIDSTFGTDGIFEKDFGGMDICRGVTVQSDNKIILTGFDQNNASPNLIRLLPEGVEDGTFSGNWNGSSKYPYSFPYKSIVLEDDKILNIGFAWDSVTTKINLYVIRLLTDGTKDTSFGTQGEFRFNITGEDTYGIYGLERKSGKIVIVGNAGNASSKEMDLFAMGLNSDGSVDVNFQDNGIYQHRLSSNYDLLNCVHLASDSTLIATGYYSFASYTHKPVIVQFKMDDSVNGITPLNSPLNFSVFPNPLHSDVLQFENTSKESLSISIFNLTGQKVLGNLKVNPSSKGSINLEALKGGMYIIRVNSESSAASKTISIVKN